MSEDFTSQIAGARQVYKQGDVSEAFKQLRPVLASAVDLDKNQWRAAFELFVPIGKAFAGSEFAQLIKRMAARRDDPIALIEAADAMAESGIEDVAGAVYLRANGLMPERPEILSRISNAFVDLGRYRQTAQLLRQSPKALSASYDCRYLLTFNTLMSGDLDEAARLYGSLVQEGVQDKLVEVVKRVGDMLARAEAIRDVTPLNEHDLRGWHYVITGGILLHESPFGRDDVMNGRYAFFQDNAELQHESIMRLAAVLRAWHITIPLVLTLPDRESMALGTAMGRVLECPVREWSAANTQPGLIVAYDFELLDEVILQQLYEHQSGQFLWNYASKWTDFVPFAVDLTTYLYEFQTSPWQAGRLRAEPGTNKVTRSEEVAGTPDELAAQILETSVREEDLADLPALTRLAETVRGQAAAFQPEGSRLPQWVGGPVPSSGFNLSLP